MNKKFQLLSIAVITAASVTTLSQASWAADEMHTTTDHQRLSENVESQISASGTVESVDVLSGKVVIKTSLLSSEEFSVKPHTMIMDGDAHMELAALQNGSKVKVNYIEQDGKNIAQAISLKKI